MNNLAQPQKGSITVMRNLEEMAAYRASKWTRPPVEIKTPESSNTAQPASKNFCTKCIFSQQNTACRKQKSPIILSLVQ